MATMHAAARRKRYKYISTCSIRLKVGWIGSGLVGLELVERCPDVQKHLVYAVVYLGKNFGRTLTWRARVYKGSMEQSFQWGLGTKIRDGGRGETPEADRKHFVKGNAKTLC